MVFGHCCRLNSHHQYSSPSFFKERNELQRWSYLRSARGPPRGSAALPRRGRSRVRPTAVDSGHVQSSAVHREALQEPGWREESKKSRDRKILRCFTYARRYIRKSVLNYIGRESSSKYWNSTQVMGWKFTCIQIKLNIQTSIFTNVCVCACLCAYARTWSARN